MDKKLILRNVFGRRVAIKDANTEDIKKVSTLPVNGEKGQFYYNSTNDTYYVYDGTKFKPVGGDVNPPIVDNLQGTLYEDDDINLGTKFTLEPNIYYDLGTTNFDVSQVKSIYLDVDESTDVALSYMGRFSIAANSSLLGVVLPDYCIIPDEQAEKLADLEAGHTYEFNIFANVFMISDITDTE